MQFCKQCDNMYYLKINPIDDKDCLMYYCRNCGDECDMLNDVSCVSVNSICVSKTVIKQDESKFMNVINEYTKEDPTLPRTNAIRCPNEMCSSNGENPEHENDIIYLRYDDTHMKYVYMCAHCDTVWKTNERK